MGEVTIRRTQNVPMLMVGLNSVENVFAPNVSNCVVCEDCVPACCVSKYHLTVVGPLVSMVPSILLGEIRPPQLGNESWLGFTFIDTFVTAALGVSTTGMLARLPAVFVTLAATQQFLPELSGSTIYHQLKSPLLPTICEVCPTVNPLTTTHSMAGPKRQLTDTSLGNAIGIVGVEVKVGGGVSVGVGVCVGVSVGKACVADGRTSVGVSVTGTLDGRLQACSTNARINTNINILGFIAAPSLFISSYPTMIPLAIDHLDSVPSFGADNFVGKPQSPQRNQRFFSMISVLSVAKVEFAHPFSHSVILPS